VLEYRDGAGKDHLWVKFYGGNQTVADPLMRAKFGGDADRPYTVEMVGRGVSYFVATALQNRALFANIPEYFAEINGIPLNDPRGDNSHDNPLVGIHTIMRGIRYGEKWVYGPQNVASGNFRADNLEAQMDKCDAIVAGQKRFRFGLEVQVDQEPHAVIGELLKACEGRVAEIGGVYKFLVGEPDAPVVAITDEDIVITEGQTYEPFPGLEATFNGITATYPEPDEAWESKEAPPRYRADLEVLDDSRRLPFATDYRAVPFPVQVQALMRAAIEETRRFRKHTQTMPPEWWEYEPLDTYAWTSARNGYANKLFLVTAMEDLPNSYQFIGGQEIDPADYDWSSDYELPWSVSPLVVARPAPQEVTGFYVEPAIALDSGGNPRRPAIDVFWSAASVTVDVRAVRITVRLAVNAQLVWEGEAPRPELGSARLTEALLPNDDYEVQIEYLPHSGRATVASSWLPVTTPNVKLTGRDVIFGDIDLDELGDQVGGYFEWIGGTARELIERLQEQDLRGADQDLANAGQFDEMRRSLGTSIGAVKASFDEVITVAIVPLQQGYAALSDQLTTVMAEVEDMAASVTLRGTAQASPGGGWARWGVEVKVGTEGEWSSAAFFLDNNGTTSRAVFSVGQFVITDGDSVEAPFIFEDGEAKMVAARIGTVRSGRLESFDGKFVIDLDLKRISIST
jgi:hypothetical protein